MNDHDAVLGIDGCPGGWVGALVQRGRVTWYAGSLAELVGLGAAVTAVDIPLAMPVDGRRRACEVTARARLGPARSSVFFTPPACVLRAGSHAEASVLSRTAGSVGVSIQTWNIVPRIAEACAFPDLLEAHPELSFRALGAVTSSKKTARGREERLALLRSWLPSLVVERPGRAAVDDCLDALACAWTAARWLRGEAQELGREVLGGRLSRIVV
jgi:predicted RNase H-like nuclease